MSWINIGKEMSGFGKRPWNYSVKMTQASLGEKVQMPSADYEYRWQVCVCMHTVNTQCAGLAFSICVFASITCTFLCVFIQLAD